MQAVMVSLMSLMFLYAMAYVKSRALSRGPAASLVSDQRLFRLDQHPIALIHQTQPNKEEDTQKRRKLADMKSI